MAHLTSIYVMLTNNAQSYNMIIIIRYTYLLMFALSPFLTFRHQLKRMSPLKFFAETISSSVSHVKQSEVMHST